MNNKFYFRKFYLIAVQFCRSAFILLYVVCIRHLEQVTKALNLWFSWFTVTGFGAGKNWYILKNRCLSGLSDIVLNVSSTHCHNFDLSLFNAQIRFWKAIAAWEDIALQIEAIKLKRGQSIFLEYFSFCFPRKWLWSRESVPRKSLFFRGTLVPRICPTKKPDTSMGHSCWVQMSVWVAPRL